MIVPFPDFHSSRSRIKHLKMHVFLNSKQLINQMLTLQNVIQCSTLQDQFHYKQFPSLIKSLRDADFASLIFEFEL